MLTDNYRPVSPVKIDEVWKTLSRYQNYFTHAKKPDIRITKSSSGFLDTRSTGKS